MICLLTFRSTIKELPRTLIFNLKRFEYDCTTMRRVKLNDYFSFPPEIDMASFTSAGFAGQEASSTTMYKLAGILVHSGTADSGHYYSFISHSSTWFHFNDSNVELFDDKNIPAYCFGGFEEWEGKKMVRNYCAYMLLFVLYNP